MPSTASFSWGRIAAQAVLGGIAAAAVFDLYTYLTVVLPSHGSMGALWQSDAAIAVGKVAFTSATYVWVGVLVHALVSIGWAGGYAYWAVRQPILRERWLIAGPVYGIIVLIAMQLILLAVNLYRFPATPTIFVNGVVAYAVFFGLPLAYVVKTLDRERGA
jgi:hypothetical protein